MKSEARGGQEEKCTALWESDTMKTAICDGMLKEETRMLRCRQCRKRRKHRWLVWIDSWNSACSLTLRHISEVQTTYNAVNQA